MLLGLPTLGVMGFVRCLNNKYVHMYGLYSLPKFFALSSDLAVSSGIYHKKAESASDTVQTQLKMFSQLACIS